jgi:pimeloyl-ACP methyl ester carboxylesterase
MGQPATGERPDERREEIRALSRLAFDELARTPVGIGELHQAIARRAFSGVMVGVGAAGEPARVVHDAIAASVYGALRETTGLLGRGVDALLRRRPLDGPPLSVTPTGSAVLGAIQGLTGDALEAEGSPLAQPMAVRVKGCVVPPERAALAASFPDATGRLAVFVHGLMETERAWRLGGPPTYGDRLLQDLGFTPVEVRYNTGLHISRNGCLLAELLAALVPAWPVEVEQIVLIGHSMGGLVARSACFQADQEAARWVRRVHHVVSLGTPHMGAPLEQIVHYASAALHAVPETRPVARFLRRRSAGIRDLRQGSLVDEDWRDRDPDVLRAEACREVPLLDCATHCFVSATITREPKHPLGRLIGDLLVLVPSASGRSRKRRIPFQDEYGLHVGKATHFALLNHPAIYERLREWLAIERAHESEASSVATTGGRSMLAATCSASARSSSGNVARS